MRPRSARTAVARRIRNALVGAVTSVRSRRAATPGRFVFVVTYGRSGSTLVQGLLNTLPGTLVRGENNLYVLPLFRAYALLQEFQEEHARHDQDSTTSAFYGLGGITPDEMVDTTRSLVTKHLLGDVDPAPVDVIGFKEVLWHRIEEEETERFFAFLDEVFPGAVYVCNRRDHAQVADSGFWRRQDAAEVERCIRRVEEIQEHLHRTRPDRVVDTRYEELTGDDEEASDRQLSRLATAVVGHCDDQLLARLRTTLQTGHGPRPFGRSRRRPSRRSQEDR